MERTKKNNQTLHTVSARNIYQYYMLPHLSDINDNKLCDKLQQKSSESHDLSGTSF